MLHKSFILFFITLLSFAAKAEVLYFTIGVPNLEEAAKKMAKAGFTLKVPHHYEKGVQRGMVVQSIKLANGQYFQLVGLDKGKGLGALAKWYQERMDEKPVGATLVLKSGVKLKELQKLYEQSAIKSEYQSFPRYEWLSFKSDSPYAPISFIDQTYLPHDTIDLTDHPNKVTGLGRITIRPVGDTSVWAKILTLSQAQDSSLSFETALASGKGLISAVELKTTLEKVPGPIKLGFLTLTFISSR